MSLLSISEGKMQLIHIKGDLFSCPQHIHLAHCISFDAKMSRGIAVDFQHRFDLRQEILNTHRQIGGVVAVWRDTRFIVQLITKFRCFHKPSPQTLYASLIALRNFMEHNNITEIAMPEIAAGLDKIPLSVSIDFIYKVFQNTPVNIYMYHW